MSVSVAGSLNGLVLSIDKFAVHDGPGIRTSVYLKGCPLGCVWCHSPESRSGKPELLYLESKCTACGFCLSVCPENAIKPLGNGVPGATDGEPCRVGVDRQKCTACGDCAEVCYPEALKVAGQWMSADSVASEVEKDRAFFEASEGGMTLTGGEVLRQWRFAAAVLGACRERGIHTAVETSGYGAWEWIQALVPVTDLFLYDLKHMEDARHLELTGVSNRPVLSNLRRLADLGAEVVVRVPCVPGITDTEDNILNTAVFVREIGLRRIELLPFNPVSGAKYLWVGQRFTLPDLEPQTSEQMEELAGICQSIGLEATVSR